MSRHSAVLEHAQGCVMDAQACVMEQRERTVRMKVIARRILHDRAVTQEDEPDVLRLISLTAEEDRDNQTTDSYLYHGQASLTRHAAELEQTSKGGRKR